MMNRIPAVIVVMFALFGGACAQKQVSADVSAEELSLKFNWIFQKGESTVRRVSQSSIPNAPPLPTGFVVLDGRRYVVRSTEIASEPLVTVNRLSGTQGEFGSIRILELSKTELSPSGYEWRDCTVLPKSIEEFRSPVEPHVAEYVRGYNLEMAKYFPDFSLKRVACSPEMYQGNGKDLYLLAVRQVQSPPSSPFTVIKLNLETAETNADGEARYVVSVANTGNKDAAEINLLSDFSVDVGQISMNSSQGKCAPSISGYGSFVCHLGPLIAGRSATVTLVASPKPAGDPNYRDISNAPWSIEGYAKERAADPNWSANRLDFEPLKNRK